MMQFKTEQFSGPLDLLLRLIEKEELDITSISLAKITDQYIGHIRSSPYIKPAEMADFLVIAAKLLLIKSKALFPNLASTELDEETEDLEKQLKIYKEFLDASKKINAIIGKKRFMFPREFDKKALMKNVKFFSPPKKISADILAMVISDLVIRLRPILALEEDTIIDNLSIEEKILRIHEFIKTREKMGFMSLLDGSGSKTELIVSFLALLELIKQRIVYVSQESHFMEIEIRKCEGEVSAIQSLEFSI